MRPILPVTLLACLALLLFAACSDDPTGTDPEVNVEITAPADGSTHVEGDDITFTGSATDPAGAAITGDDLVWTSSLDGRMGTGETLVADPSDGEHTVTLTATAADGLEGSASIDITVEEGVVVATIAEPEDEDVFVEEEDITFVGSAVDPSGEPLTGDALVWTEDKNGDPLGTGETFTTTLPVGTRTIILTATDAEERTGTDQVTFTIAPAVTAEITSPTAEGTYHEDTPVQLAGSAETHDGTPLTGDALVWRSSITGIVGTGESVSTLLPEGEQEISLTATDPQGRYDRRAVDITVGGDGVMYNHTGNWSFTSSSAWVNGDYFDLPEPMSGFCTINQVGNVMTLLFTDGYLPCDPAWICDFTGTGSVLTYNLGNSGEVDFPGETLTNALTLTSYSATTIDGVRLSVYEFLDGSTDSMGFNLWFTKIE